DSGAAAVSWSAAEDRRQRPKMLPRPRRGGFSASDLDSDSPTATAGSRAGLAAGLAGLATGSAIGLAAGAELAAVGGCDSASAREAWASASADAFSARLRLLK